MTALFRLIGKGILVLLPVIILLWILKFVYDIIASIIGVIFDTTAHNLLATMGILIVMVLILAYAGHLLEKSKDFVLLKISEFAINKIPYIASIYAVSKDIVEMFLGSKNDTYLGVAHISLGELEVIGFITKEEDDFYWVFVPATPNPTSGFLLKVPKDKIKKSNLSVADGLKKVVSLGIK